VAGVAEGLFETHAATAPPIDLIVDFRLFYEDGSLQRGDWLQGFIRSLAGEFAFNISMDFDVEVGLVLLGEGDGGVAGLDDPCFGGDLLHLLEEVASGSQQHNYFLIIN
jgi:hypothetical protein